MPSYPLDSASLLHVFLGFVNTDGNLVGNALTINIATGFNFIPEDDNCILMVMGAGVGGTPLWTTVSAFGSAINVTLAASATQNVIGAQIVIYREIAETDPAAPYVLQGTLQFNSALTTPPTLNFSIFSPDGSFIPKVGQPVLLTHESWGDLFGGFIDQTQASNYPTQLPTATQCQCVSWNMVLARRLLRLAVPAGPTGNDTFHGGFSYFLFPLSNVPSLITSITLNGVAQTISLSNNPDLFNNSYGGGEGAQFYYRTGSNLVRQDPSGVVLGASVHACGCIRNPRIICRSAQSIAATKENGAAGSVSSCIMVIQSGEPLAERCTAPRRTYNPRSTHP